MTRAEGQVAPKKQVRTPELGKADTAMMQYPLPISNLEGQVMPPQRTDCHPDHYTDSVVREESDFENMRSRWCLGLGGNASPPGNKYPSLTRLGPVMPHGFSTDVGVGVS